MGHQAVSLLDQWAAQLAQPLPGTRIELGDDIGGRVSGLLQARGGPHGQLLPGWSQNLETCRFNEAVPPSSRSVGRECSNKRLLTQAKEEIGRAWQG